LSIRHEADGGSPSTPWVAADNVEKTFAQSFFSLIAIRGRPLMIVSDNGTELTGMTMLRWSQDRQVGWHYITPGKRQQNAFIESLRAACVMSC
jgi:putative transposase